MERKRRRGVSTLTVRVLATVFVTILALQAGSTFVVYSLIERDLKSKRAADMDAILSSVVYTLSSPTLGGSMDVDDFPHLNPNASQLEGQMRVCKQAYDEVFPKYADKVGEMGDSSPLMDTYLQEFETSRLAHQGMGMTQYGDVRVLMENLLDTIATPSSSAYIYTGFFDAATNNFVVAAGAYDSRYIQSPAENAVAQNVTSSGYFFPWAQYSKVAHQASPEGDGFIGYEYVHPTKGALSVSGRRFYFSNDGTGEKDVTKPYWVFLETDMSYFTDQTARFSLTFLYTSLGTLAVLFIALALLIYFPFVRRINRLSGTAEQAVDALGQGQPSKHFALNEAKHPDEIHRLNNDIAYFEGELLSYMKEREATIQQEEKNRAEMAFSAQIQHASLPDKPIHDKAISIAPRIQLAKEVGGDLYDYFYIDDHRFLFLIGDVSGKGVPAALFMMQAIAKIKATLSSGKDFHLGQEINAINNELSAHNPMSLFVTAFIGVVDTEKGTLSYVNCGHEEAFFRHNGVYTMLQGPSNLPLGVIEGFEFQMETIKLAPQDSIYLYTDGVSEAENVEGEFFGKQRIGDLLNALPHVPSLFLVDDMMESVIAFQKGKEQSDDICMLSFTYRPLDQIVFDNDMPNLDKAQEFVSETLKELKGSETLTVVSLALDEILTNVISYAYGQEKGLVFLGIRHDKKKKEIQGLVVDRGVAFNPLLQEPNQDIANIPGGLGILIAKNVLTELEYFREEDYNILLFTKKVA